MKTTAFSLAAAALVLGACSHTRETVVERPVPAPTKEVVIERTVPSGALPRACSYAGRAYSDGSIACQNEVQFRCSDGAWEGLNTRC